MWTRKPILIIAIIRACCPDLADLFQYPQQAILGGVHPVYKHTAELIMKEHFTQRHKDSGGLRRQNKHLAPELEGHLFFGSSELSLLDYRSNPIQMA